MAKTIKKSNRRKKQASGKANNAGEKKVVQADENKGNSDLSNAEKKNTVCVVIPYLHEKAIGKELLFALRAWAINLPDAEIVIIGDKPDYVSDLVKHIPVLSIGDNPQIDVATKLMQAIASELVPEEFILSNDDIYPINTVSIEDLRELRCAGMLGDKKKANTKYLEKTLNTKASLEAHGLPIFDYGTHLPVIYSKADLAEVLVKYGAEENGLLISSLYFNTKYPLATPEVTKGNASGEYVAYVYRENPNAEALAQVFQDRKFINHNSAGYSPVLPFLERVFPEKSKFEK